VARHVLQIMFEICVVGVHYIYDWFCKKIFLYKLEWGTIDALTLLSNFNFGPHYLSS